MADFWHPTRSMFGCYSFPNHVLSDRPELGLGVAAPTFREALAVELPGVQFEHVRGCPVREPDTSGIQEAVDLARAADIALVVVGDLPGMFGIGTSGEGCDVEDLRLPGVQEQLVDAVLDTGTPTVLLVCSGRPYAVGRFHGRAAAIVQTFLPGEEGGPALASLLAGRANFRGKLPAQIGSSPGGQPHTYLHAPLGGKQSALSNLDPSPTFPFGHGLSYTRFDVADMRVDRTQVGCDEEFEVSVHVANTGGRAGVEVVQLYGTDPVAQVARPVRALLSFAAVDLAAGERAIVVFRVHAEHFAYTGLDGHLVVEPGVIVLAAGRSSEDLPATAEVRLTGPARRLRKREYEHVDHRIVIEVAVRR
ncbi:hypothetical protein ALI22I_10055 [Saccharothrix sp. ALI-22-I]|uniref:glycoside hydrolase family 3 C-terminal domain-containing protein n=1 Tax=Saccharothrix sp. ALI-22-I TaxID=1933778 RepID=UPI00097BCF1B|nr:glycoside hydrolase family 3 C-terminal domain-containing protein [Saccharothrix sp. ALI-22-I]ONI91099.1 hypothetical protein ALI22I_10055 [Saccharothrix sp. ALI-22-I]